MKPVVDLRLLRYFVAVAEELHVGRAAARLHMSQSPLSRAIRELERELGVTLFHRTTRSVELIASGTALLARAREALAGVDRALEAAQDAARPASARVTIGHGPLSYAAAACVAEAVAAARPGAEVRLDEDLSHLLLERVARREVAAAVVLELPLSVRPGGVRLTPLCDEPLLCALPAGHPLTAVEAVPLAAFAAERVLLPRCPVGDRFNAWLRAIFRIAGLELADTVETLSAPWDRRMLPVARGEAVSVFVADWAGQDGVVAVPFDPPLALQLSLAWSEHADPLTERAVQAALDEAAESHGARSGRPGSGSVTGSDVHFPSARA